MLHPKPSPVVSSDFNIPELSSVAYVAECTKLQIRPNKYVLSHLHDAVSFKCLLLLDLRETLLGPKGSVALCALIKHMHALEELNLAECGITAESVDASIDTWRTHPMLCRIDLSDNFIPLSGMPLGFLVRMVPRITGMRVKNTCLTDKALSMIEAALKRNTQGTAPSWLSDKTVKDDPASLRDALERQVFEMERAALRVRVASPSNEDDLVGQPSNGTAAAHATSGRFGDGLSKTAMMDRGTLKGNYHKVWYLDDKKQMTDMWKWVLRLPYSVQQMGTQDEFHLEDLHCKHAQTHELRGHSRRNLDRQDDPSVCCLWKGYAVVVDRLIKDVAFVEALERRGTNAGWRVADIANGCLACFIYTFEARTREGSRPTTHYGLVNRVLREFCNPVFPVPDERRNLREQWLSILTPFIQTLQTFVLDCLPRVPTTTTFRGIGIPVARQYITGSCFIWPAFSSTSRSADVAMEFAQVKCRQGSFFQLNVESGRDISPFSMFPAEAEILLPAASCFTVGQRLSDTLLLMSGFSSDMVVCAEVSGNTKESARDVVQWRLDSFRRARYLYAPIKDTYVTPRLASTEFTAERDLVPLLGEGAAQLPWSAAAPRGSNIILVLADGGMGKTMTSARLWLDVAESTNKYTPLFVSLPQLFRSDGRKTFSLVEYLQAHLVLPTDGGSRNFLTLQPLVVFLDSLDEVTTDIAAITRGAKMTLSQVLNLREFKNSIFVFTCRKEFMGPKNIQPSDVHRGLTLWYLRAPGPREMESLARSVGAKLGVTGEALDALTHTVVSNPDCGNNPFRATLTVHALVHDDKTPGDVWSIYRGALMHHYSTSGINKVWSPVISGKVRRWRETTGEEESGDKQWLCDQAYVFAAILALRTFLDGTWPTGMSVVHYKKTIDWFEDYHAFGVGVDRLTIDWLAPVLFDMQPLRAESTEDGVFAFRHKSIQEHLIATCILHISQSHFVSVNFSEPPKQRPQDGRVSDIPTRHPGILDHCCAVARQDTPLIPKLQKCLTVRHPGLGSLAATILVRCDRTALCGADLSGSVLRGANLSGAVLIDTKLSVSDLEASDLQHVELLGLTTLRGATLKGVRFGRYPSLVGHTQDVLSISALSDSTVLSGARDGTINVWSMDTLTPVGSIVLNAGIHTLCCQGNTNVCLTDDGGMALVNTETIEISHETRANHTWVCCDLSFDGACIAVGTTEGTLDLVDGSTLVPFAQLVGHLGTVFSVCYAPDGLTVISCGDDGTVRVWSTDSMSQLAVLPVSSDWESKPLFTAVHVSPNASRILAGTKTGHLVMWNFETHDHIDTVQGHNNCVSSIRFSTDSTRVATASLDGSIALWDASSIKEISRLNSRSNEVRCVRWAYSGSVVLYGGDDDTVSFWETSAAVLGTKPHLVGSLTASVLCEETLYTASSDMQIKRWNIGDSAAGDDDEPTVIHAHTHTTVRCMVVKNGREVWCGGEDGSVFLALSDNADIAHLHTGTITGMAITSDGNLLTCAADTSELMLWDLGNMQYHTKFAPLARYTGHVRPIMCVATQGNVVVSASTDYTLRLWDLAKRVNTMTFTGHTHYVVALSFAPRSNIVASASWDASIRIWDVVAKTMIRTVYGHAGAVNTLCFLQPSALAPEGSLPPLVSAGNDGTLRVWNSDTGEVMATTEGHSCSVSNVMCFSTSGFVSGAMDLRFWSFDGARLRLGRVEGSPSPFFCSKSVATTGVVCDQPWVTSLLSSEVEVRK